MQNTAIDAVSLELTGLSWWSALFLIAAAVACAIWYYHRTVPPLSGWRQYGMTIVRGLALFLIVVGLAGPVLTITATSVRQTATVFLLDTSASMDTPLDPGRAVAARDALSRLRAGLDGESALYAFDSVARPADAPPLTYDGAATDLSVALGTVLVHPDAAAIVLISDGRWNSGSDPRADADTYPLPVHTVIAGSAVVAPDASLSGLSVAPVGRDGSTLPVEVGLSSTVPVTEPVPVTIAEDGAVVASGTIPPNSGKTARIRLEIPLTGIGTHRFDVSIAPADDAISVNNSRSFEVEALKNSFEVLIAAAHPSPDLAFLRRIIDRDSSFTADVAVGGGAGGDVLDAIPASLADYDAVILIDGGGALLTVDSAAALRERILAGTGLWMLGSSPPGPGGAVLEQALPVRFSGSGARADSSLALALTGAGRAHFITAQSAGAAGAWGMLPPPGSLLPMETDTRAMSVLVAAAPGNTPDIAFPAIAAGALGAGKVLVMPLSGIWRWSLRMTGAGYEDDFLARFSTGALNWLTSPADTSPLSVTTGGQSYLAGETVGFEARLFDHIYAPVAGAELTLTVDGDPATKTLLAEDEPGRYRAARQGVPPGEHTWEAIAALGGTEYARAEGSFTVQAYSLELRDPSADPAFMLALASATGGIAVTAAGADSLIGAIESAPRAERHTTDHHLALHPLIPFAAILLLLAEWGIRTARGMI